MMKKALLVLAVLLVAGSVQARLGLTDEELNQKYGNPLLTNGSVKIYKISDFMMGAVFHDGRTIALSYWKGTIDNKQIPDQITMDKILKANSSGLEWALIMNDGTGRLWARSDGAAYAKEDLSDNDIKFMTKGYLDNHQAKLDAVDF